MHRQTQTQTKSQSSFDSTKSTPSSPTKFHIIKQQPQHRHTNKKLTPPLRSS
ncbi:hypothetical protein Hanom_Chr05g00462101 [Helianthus anomalus]